MYLCYVDDSGSGSEGITTLTGILVHEDDWTDYVEALVARRKDIEQRFSIGKYLELHAVKLFKRPGKRPRMEGERYLDQLTVEEKLEIGRLVLSCVTAFDRCRILTVCSREPYAQGSARLYPRFLEQLNAWANAQGEHVIVHYDGQQAGAGDWESSLRNAQPFRTAHRRHPDQWVERRMVLEDPVLLDSKTNLTIQAADIMAFCMFCMIRGKFDGGVLDDGTERGRLRAGAAGLCRLFDGQFASTSLEDGAGPVEGVVFV